ncbi:hypothetical protein [Pusillimonas sp.]|uniref:hypothetical protein n=1 Tax=Pusillimonas sp. TaxID=3040095 RepID=UPI0037C67B08
MTVQTWSRLGLSLLLTAAISGCSSSGGSIQCKVSPSSCMHEGSYEPGEEEYAEEEAKDLNKAASRKVRRSSGSWW